MIGKFGRAYAKGKIITALSPYIEALQDGGVGREEFEFLVNNNQSFYQNYIPKAWKKLIVQELAPYASEVKDLTDDTILLFVEAVSEVIPWFAEVVKREKIEWLRNEVALVLSDLRAFQES